MRKRVKKNTVAKDCSHIRFVNGVAVCALNFNYGSNRQKMRFGKIRNFNAVKCNKKKGCGYSPIVNGIVADLNEFA